jgi:FAD/FMN-containing dehydrogenase/Fe-S oxidoreductase
MSPRIAPNFPRSRAEELARTLSRRIAGEVRFDDGDRALYATDASNYRQPPIGVVIPYSVDDVLATVATCREFEAPVLPRGGGTSLAGQCCNVAVVIDFSKRLNRILEIDAERRIARVEPGCVLDHLRDAAERHHLTFGPDPATHDHNTLGGMIGNNSCGVHSVMAGRTSDNVRALDIVTYDGERMTLGATSPDELERIIAAGGRRGEIYSRLRTLRDRHADEIRKRFPEIPRRVSGYNLPQLLPENGFHLARALVGSEGTCALLLGATLDLVPSPPCRALLVLGFEDIYTAADAVPEILTYGPVGLEGIDDRMVTFLRRKSLESEDIKLLPEGGGWLLVEFGGDSPDDVRAKAERARDGLAKRAHAKLLLDAGQQHHLWALRESGLPATALVPGQRDTWEGWEDSAVPPAQLGAYLRELRALFERYGYGCSLYGHFGDGCVHTRIDFDLRTWPGVAHFRSFVGEAADLVMRHGGSFSGEHGDGQSRAELLPKMFGPEIMDAFAEFKGIWDPLGRMNPGKVVDPYLITENLRIGPDVEEPRIETVFDYPEDDRRFFRTTLRCVGVGACRHRGKGVMCPSYMATREEKHSTRGRARMLFEMVRGDVIKDGWRSEAVRDALDLCLACKGCKGDCPMNVDMATYKAEFNAHHYEGRLRPRAAYSMGQIQRWARVAALAPGVANALMRTPGLQAAIKWCGGVAQAREIPPFAPQTFQRWARRRGYRDGRRGDVVLFADTFNNHFLPRTAQAAVRTLEDAGYGVVTPKAALCCGRPLFAWGMLDQAKRQLGKIMQVLTPYLERDVAIVGLEPACVATFRDELPRLFPDDPRAEHLQKRSFMLAEFLVKEAGYEPPRLPRRAVVHAHCHQRAVIGTREQKELLEAMGMEVEMLDAGCCGMAGSFGFERDHYDVAMRIAEQRFLPAMRAAGRDAVLIANGYSCREQAVQGAGRMPLHIADVLALALDNGAKP